jgi:hypothetical protein
MTKQGPNVSSPNWVWFDSISVHTPNSIAAVIHIGSIAKRLPSRRVRKVRKVKVYLDRED